MRGGSPMLLRSSGKTGVRAATVRTGSRVAGRASAWMVGWARVFCWLFARRSITQKEVAVDGQVCAAVPFGDCVHRVAVGHCGGGVAGWLMLETLRAADERGGLGHKQREQQHHNGCGENASRCGLQIAGSQQVQDTPCQKAMEGLRPVFFGPRTLLRTRGTRPVSCGLVLGSRV